MHEGARHALRAATAADHAAVDRAFGAFDLADRDRYVEFLTAQAWAFLPIEAAIDRSSPLEVLPDWPARRRSDALRADLAALAEPLPSYDTYPPFDGPPAVLGAIYVLEGSRLGGRMLARGVLDTFPQSFLSAGNSALWRSLLTVLEVNLVTGAQRETAITAARAVFALFEKGARVLASSR